MNKLLFLCALMSPAAAWAGPAGTTGLGLIGGSPSGATAKYWFTDDFAVDGGVGYGNAAVFYADVVAHHWRLLPETTAGKTNLYAAVGPRIASDDGGQFSFRVMGGFAFWPKDYPLEVFAEVGPTFKVTPDNKVGIDGGLGFRYYFNVSLTPANP